MNLEYEMTRQDYIDFNIYHMTHSTTMKRSLLIQRFIFPIIFLICPLLLTKITTIPLWYWTSIFIITSILWIAFYPKILKRLIEKKVSQMLEEGKTTGIVGIHNLSVSEDGIIDKTEFSETKYDLIEKIVESETHIFIYVSAVMAYIIPIRVFAIADEKDNFLSIISKLDKKKVCRID